MDERKPIWRSRTFWFNVGTGFVAVGQEAATLVDVLPEAWGDAIRLFLVMFTVIGNVILRSVTSEPVRVRGKGA